MKFITHKIFALYGIPHSSRNIFRLYLLHANYFYLEEVSKHCQSYLQRSATRKMTGRYFYTTTEDIKGDFYMNFPDFGI